MIQVREILRMKKKTISVFVLVYLVTCDILEEKEFVQTKFSRDNENVLSLAKNLVNKE